MEQSKQDRMLSQLDEIEKGYLELKAKCERYEKALKHIGNGCATPQRRANETLYGEGEKLKQWWEGGKVDEMPEYVKCITTPDQKIMPGQVFKVKWAFTYAGRAATGQWIVVNTGCFEPATLDDYNAYLQTTNQNNE